MYQSAQLGLPSCFVPHFVFVSAEWPMVDVGSALPDLRDVNATVLTEHAFETLENCAIATIDMGLQLRWFPGIFLCELFCITDKEQLQFLDYTSASSCCIGDYREHCVRDSFRSQDISLIVVLFLFCN